MKAARRFSGMNCKINLLILVGGYGERGVGSKRDVCNINIFSRLLDSGLYSETILSLSGRFLAMALFFENWKISPVMVLEVRQNSKGAVGKGGEPGGDNSVVAKKDLLKIVCPLQIPTI